MNGDRKLAAALALWAIAIPLLAFLAWASLRGFDPSFCDVQGACGWRVA